MTSDTNPPDLSFPQSLSKDQSADSEGLLLHVSLPAMATRFEVLLRAKAEREEVDVALGALQKIEELERMMTVYQPLSDVSRINTHAEKEAVKVDQHVIDVIEIAADLSRRSAGAFDITAGPLVEAWGFTQRSGRKPNDQQVQEALDCVGFQFLEVDRQRRTVRFKKPGMRINLGAVGKGYALDQAAAMLRGQDVQNFLIHGGQSSLVAAGTRRDQESGWPISLAHPTRPQRKLGRFWVCDGSLSTSGSGKQFFHHRGQRLGHVIDPRNGYPAGDMLSLSVLSKSCAVTDALATGLFVQGREAACQFAAEAEDIGIVGVAGSNDSKVEVFSTGLSDGQWEAFTD